MLRSFSYIVEKGEKDSESKENDSITLDLNAIKQKNPQDWSQDDLKGVLQILLLTCQSYLTNSNLNTAMLRKIIVFGDEKAKDFKSILPSTVALNLELSTDREKRLVMTASEKRLEIDDDVCTQARNELSKEKYSLNIASKMVTNKLRDWGRQVPCKNKAALSKKYQLSSSYRM